MIIKATRISTTSGAGGVGGHVFAGKGNQEITEIMGCREDLDDMVADAQRYGAKYSIRHVTISPAEATTRDEALDLVHQYCREFGADASRAVVVEHRKAREGGEGYDRHWHAMIPEVQDGRVLDSSWMRPRHEKLSRIAEIELGHGMVPGRWNQAVEDALRDDGRTDMADRVTALTEEARPTSAYTSEQHQAAKAAGVSMPHTKATAKAAAAASWTAADGGKSFVAALAAADLRLVEGTKKPGVYVVQARGLDGEWADLAAIDRLIKVDRKEVVHRLVGVDLDPAPEPVRMTDEIETPASEAAPQGTPTTVPEPTVPDTAPAAPEAVAVTAVPQAEPETSQPAPAWRPAPSPISGAPAPSSGGGGGGGGSDPFASIAPLDLSKPGDWLRLLNQTANAQAQKLRAEAAAEAARPTSGGSNAAPKPNQPSDYSFADAIVDAIQRGREIRAERAAGPSPEPSADEPNLDRRGLTRDRGPDGPRPGLSPSGDGPPGAVADSVRRVPGRPDFGSAPPPPGPPRAEGGRDEPARPGDPAPGTDRGEPSEDRAARGRDRVQARRESLGLAAAVQSRGTRLAELARQVASPPTVASIQADRARAALGASRARVAAVLETAPWPDPSDRRPGPLQDAGRDRVQSAMDARAAAAAAAVTLAEQLRGRVGIVSKVLAVVGLETPAVRAAAEATREAEEAQRAAKGARIDYREDLTAADRSGSAEASRRQRQQDTWEDRPDVRAARKEEAGNRQVVAAVKSGDPEVREALRQEDGLRIAREVIMRREMERLAETQRQQLHKQRTAAAGTALRPGPAIPAPAFRS